MKKKSAYTILIICEGQNTEPQFFRTIRDCIIDGEYDLGIENCKIEIRPEPRVEQEPESNIRKRKKRTLRIVEEEPDEDIKGVPPLKWVQAGRRELEEDTFNEVWTVFDNDNHPARKEAFDLANESVHEKYVRIAYSSISFEYYLLLHFERIYKAFEKSECREGKSVIHCMLDDVYGCGGNKCVGGYLRAHSYIDESTKDNKSTFNLVKDKLEIGYENAAWLRYRSYLEDEGKADWDRNPFVTTDVLVKRLTGHDKKYVWISRDKKCSFEKFGLSIEFVNDGVEIKNIGKRSIIIQKNSLCSVSAEGQRALFGDRKIMREDDVASFELIDNVGGWYYFDHENLRVMFDVE